MPGEIRRKRVQKKKDSSVTHEKEVVQREGKSLVRVKSKRRRSEQKKTGFTEAGLNVIFWKTLTICGLLVFLGAGYSLRMLYVNSPKYEGVFLNDLEEQFGVKPIISGLSFGPQQIGLAKVKYAKGPEEGLVDKLRLDEINISHNGLGALTGSWQGYTAEAETGELNLNASNHFKLGLFNYKVSIANELHVKNMSIFTATDDLLLARTRCSLSSDLLSFEGGDLSIPLFETAELKRLSIHLRDNSIIDGEVLVAGNVSSLSGSVSHSEILFTFKTIGIDKVYTDSNYRWFLKEGVEGVDVTYKVSQNDAAVSGGFRSLVRVSDIEPVVALVRKLALNEYSHFVDKAMMEGTFTYSDDDLRIESAHYASPFGYAFSLERKDTGFEVVLNFPLEWERKLILYPTLKKLATIENEQYQIVFTLNRENGIVYDDLNERGIKHQQGDSEMNKKSLQDKLEQLIK